MKTKTLLKISSICAIAIMVGVGCSKKEGPQPEMKTPVLGALIEPQTIPADYRSVAQTEGSLEVEVRARVSGIMEKFSFAEGGMVSQGQQLFLIDPRPFQIALQQAQASLASAQASLDQATKNWERIEPLYKENAVSRKDYDDAQAALASAKASKMMAEANVNEAKLNLVYTRVEAPISGIVGKSIPSKGSLITAQQTLLTKISKVDPMYVNFNYSDKAYMKMAKDIASGRVLLPAGTQLAVSLKLSDESVYPMTGAINFQDIMVDAGTSTISTRATFPNPGRVLRPGQFVEATVTGMVRPNAIIVPQRAVMEGENGKFVYVINAKGQAEVRPVKEGDWYKDQWIIDEGLKAGEKIVVDGLVKVRPGAPLAVTMIKVVPGQPIVTPTKAPTKNGAAPAQGSATAGSAKPAASGSSASK